MKTKLAQDYPLHPFNLMKATTELPVFHEDLPQKSTHACAVLSLHLFKTGVKIQDSCTPDQAIQMSELLEAYHVIVAACSQFNLMEYKQVKLQHEYQRIYKENIALKEENMRLTKTLEFQNP